MEKLNYQLMEKPTNNVMTGLLRNNQNWYDLRLRVKPAMTEVVDKVLNF